jgi:hypothetical protein
MAASRNVAERNLFRAAVRRQPSAAKEGAHGGNMVSPVKRASAVSNAPTEKKGLVSYGVTQIANTVNA